MAAGWAWWFVLRHSPASFNDRDRRVSRKQET